jgi:hypothetical protein
LKWPDERLPESDESLVSRVEGASRVSLETGYARRAMSTTLLVEIAASDAVLISPTEEEVVDTTEMTDVEDEVGPAIAMTDVVEAAADMMIAAAEEAVAMTTAVVDTMIAGAAEVEAVVHVDMKTAVAVDAPNLGKPNVMERYG